MSDKSQILSVNFGDFSISLEGYEDPFSVMKQVADYMENRIAEDPKLKNKPLENVDSLSEDLSNELDVAGTVTLDRDVVHLKAVGDVELPIVTKPSVQEAEKISQDVARAIDDLQQAEDESDAEEDEIVPLSLQNPVTEEEIKDVEMTFSTDRQRRKASDPVDLEDHAENTRELPFVGKSGNKNSKPRRSKIKIIREYTPPVVEAPSEPASNLTTKPAEEQPVEAKKEPAPIKPGRTFRKLKVAPEALATEPIKAPAATEIPTKKAVQEEKQTRYRKLKV